MIEELNNILFLWINAKPSSAIWLLKMAVFIAQYLIGIVPIVIILLWIKKPNSKIRKLRLKTSIALIYALSISWCISEFFPFPRPFTISLGNQFLSHIPDNSYPSDHGTTIFTFALGFIFWHRIWSGLLLLFISITIAWSRIYLGIHWPMDMLGSLLISMLGCLFSQITWAWYTPILIGYHTKFCNWFSFNSKTR